MDCLETKAGGVGGGPSPPFANKMICITISYCKHGDDMMLLSYGKPRWPLKQPGLEGGQPSPPPLANNKDEEN